MSLPLNALACGILAALAIGAFIDYLYSRLTPMCRIHATDSAKETDLEALEIHTNKRSAFTASRLPSTSNTFLIIETHDIYSEHPFIYAKIVSSANTILIVDTGCGGASTRPVEIKSLREFIETVGVKDNDGKPLNEGGQMGYVVVLSHCHYDHILGVEHFAKDSPILASSNSPSFLAPSNLPTNSLCLSLSIPTPKYNPILIDHLSPIVSPNTNLPLGMIALHTPGHTPDSLSLWDEEDRMLYVGDTLYEKEPIIFPKEGSIIIWFEKLDYLIDLVQSKPFADDIKVSCGHTTASRPALEVFRKTKGFMQDVIAERIPVKTRTKKRGEVYVEYVQTEMDLSLICPERLVLEARNSGYAV